MKKFSTILKSALLGAFMVLMVACGKTGSGDYRNLIPENAFMTFSMNPQSIMDKAGLSDAERAAMKGQAEMAMAFMGGMLSDDDKKFVLSIIDNLDNSGISFKDNVYMAVSGDIASGAFNDAELTAIAKISDTKKLQKLLGLINKLDQSVEIRSDRGLNVIILDESSYSTTVLAYDDNAIVLFVNERDYPTTIELVSDLFKGTNALADNKDFSKFTNSKSDLSILMNYGYMMDMVKDQIPAGFPMMNVLSAAHVYANTDFVKGKIETDFGIIITDKEAEKEFEQFYNKSKINGKFSKYLSDNAIFAMGGYMDGPQVYDALVKFPQTAMIAFFPEGKEMLEALDGEVFISLSWLDELQGVLFATVKNTDILGTIVEQLGAFTDIIKVDGNYYAIDFQGMTFTFGIKDDVLFFGNDAELLAALDGNKVNNPGKEIVSMFDKGYGAFYVNFDILGDAIIGTVGRYMDSNTRTAIEVLGMFKDMRVTSDTPKEGKMVITMDDADKNAMATIADKIRAVAMSSMF